VIVFTINIGLLAHRTFVQMNNPKQLLSGNEAMALAAYQAGVALGTGYPGTPSTEILERFSELGGRGQWSPNEKVALEVALGVAFAGARALVTMKHVGLNVAADPLFTAAYTGVQGGLVIVSADDPGMASSQNEQDNRRYAVAAGLPMLEPADSQEAYDFMFAALEISERWQLPVIFRVTTRVCHSYSVVHPRANAEPRRPAHFERDIRGRVMIPSNARVAHRRLREKLAEIQAWNENCSLNRVLTPATTERSTPPRKGAARAALGIITSGVSFMHAQEAAPSNPVLKLGMTHPLPAKQIKKFVQSVGRCLVLEEGDPYLVDSIRASGLDVEGKPDMYRFGEFDVARVRRILEHDQTAEVPKPAGQPPQLCEGCQYRVVFDCLRKFDCIVAGDIGCYSLGVLKPFEAMDSLVCMGASVGVGLGLRHVLPSEQARRVVSVIGDSTFIHSGISGLVEMVYNPPANGHLLIILDNSTTAMTGQQEHPGTGRKLNHEPARKLVLENVVLALGIRRVHIVEPRAGSDEFERVLTECLECQELAVIIARRPCLLIAKQLKQHEQYRQKAVLPKSVASTINGEPQNETCLAP
jgi:indolepyruvate ferredoxin oxidoreductase, alpha subunit